jgi:hypothetical protein
MGVGTSMYFPFKIGEQSVGVPVFDLEHPARYFPVPTFEISQQ